MGKESQEKERKERDFLYDAQDNGPIEESEQFMTFNCMGEIYGISIEYVNEIIGLGSYTKVPDTDNYLIGLVNLRGKIIPVMDVRIRFGKEPLKYDDRTSIIVISVGNTTIGLIVDRIDEVADIKESQIEVPPSISTIIKQSQKYVYSIARVNEKTILLVSPAKLIGIESSEEEGNEAVS